MQCSCQHSTIITNQQWGYLPQSYNSISVLENISRTLWTCDGQSANLPVCEGQPSMNVLTSFLNLKYYNRKKCHQMFTAHFSWNRQHRRYWKTLRNISCLSTVCGFILEITWKCVTPLENTLWYRNFESVAQCLCGAGVQRREGSLSKLVMTR